jgi:GT2 family glycosyltransferase
MARSPARRLLASTKPSRAALRWADTRRAIRRIRASGVFDQEWYEIQAGAAFPDLGSAIADYVATGRRRGRSPHPLVWPMWVSPRSWKRGARDPLLRVVAPGSVLPRHPLFDSAVYIAAHPAAATHPYGPLSHFLGRVSVDTPMPSRSGPTITWGEFRDRSLRSLRECASARARDLSAASSEWDDSAEAAFLADLEGAPASGRLVTVVMPVWNRPEQLVRAVESVQRQTHTAWELVIVDDGSTDSTPQVAARLAGGDPRIRVVAEQRAGVSRARNTALGLGTGDVVAFLDSDNEWVPDHLRVMLAEMERSGSRFAHSGVRGHGHDALWFRARDGGYDELEVSNFIDLNAVVVDRALLDEVGHFDESLRRMVDWDLALRLAAAEPPRLVPFIGVDYDDSRDGRVRITVQEPRSWREVILQRRLIDWDALASRERVPGRVTVVIPTYQDWSMTVRAVRSVLATTADHDVQVVVVDNASRARHSQLLRVFLDGMAGVTYLRATSNLNFALGSNLGFAQGDGELVLFLNNDTEVQPGWLEPLLATLADPEVVGVQPLLLYPDRTVQCAGVVFPSEQGLPVHLLAGHPADDARRLGVAAVHAVTGAALLMRAQDVVRLQGFDPRFSNGWEDVDLCLRAGGDTGSPFRVVTASTVVHHEGRTIGRNAALEVNRRIFVDRWTGRLPTDGPALWEAAGFSLEGYADDAVGGLPVDLRVPRPLLARPRGSRRRWAIKASAPAGRHGDRWGDAVYAESLATALRALGQEVVVDRTQAHDRATGSLDDVMLVLRGLDPVPPRPGQLSVLWVISHPDEVEDDELRAFDLVFAAGEPWARTRSESSGRPVRTLLQATDPARFNPDRAEPTGEPPVLFVGSSRNVMRPIVRDAIDVCDGLEIYGGNWKKFLGDAPFVHPFVDNAEVGALYRRAGVVLNDHHADMAAHGFVSNRLFDAVASGARVVSDDVVGLAELFQGAVQVYASPEDLRRLTGPDRDSLFPDDAARRAIAAHVAAQHSFHARAVELVRAVEELG